MGIARTVVGAAGRLLGLGFALVVVALSLVMGTVMFGVLWFAVLAAVEGTYGLPVVVTLGLFESVGLPATELGVPLVYPVVLGALTTVLLGSGSGSSGGGVGGVGGAMDYDVGGGGGEFGGADGGGGGE